MLLTLFLLGALYVVFIAVLLAAGAGVVTMVVIIGALSLAQLFFSDKLALAAVGAKIVTPDQAPGLHAMIERLCIQADLPKPRIAVADTDVPNAFATGRSQKNAVVCATTGTAVTPIIRTNRTNVLVMSPFPSGLGRSYKSNVTQLLPAYPELQCNQY